MTVNASLGSSLQTDADPFGLTASEDAQLEEIQRHLTTQQKVGQLFCVYLPAGNLDNFLERLSIQGIEPGGFMLLPQPRDEAVNAVGRVQREAKLPLLVAGNLEAGASSFLLDESIFANPMQLGATNDPEAAGLLGQYCADVAGQIGINWAFAPVVDIALNHRNPITNVRAFSDDPDQVARFGARYVEVAEAGGLATTVKHFPGDGVDDRDQHLLTTNNMMSVEDWDSSFGMVYRRVIEAGARTLMVGHIRLPHYSRHLRPGIADHDILPASMAEEILIDLLRQKLGFRGLVVTDNTAMAGMTAALPRSRALPLAINAGCDMLLGVRDLEEDYGIISKAVADGSIPVGRVDEAVRHVLRLKASLGLIPGVRQRSPSTGPSRPEAEARAAAWRRKCAEEAITLVKDTQKLLPIDSVRHRRTLLYVLGDAKTFYEPAHGLADVFADELRRRGVQVDVRHIPAAGRSSLEATKLHERYDLCLYFANVKFAANSNVLRLAWSEPQGPDAPRHVQTLPTALVSVSDPYHLQDMPMVKTAVNGYTPSAEVVRAIVARLFGEAPFTGTSPVDPFAGYWDAKL